MVSHANHGSARDHLRVCGADASRTNPASSRSGSPPRVRSRRAAYLVADDAAGITSACAEQTRFLGADATPTWDHLRVCGADPVRLVNPDGTPGSPPRVRSRPLLVDWLGLEGGITSACAEQTPPSSPASATSGDHLRVCGADRLGHHAETVTGGSPPRVRSRPPPAARRRHHRGITSACAEQTLNRVVQESCPWDHLRVCGADAGYAGRCTGDDGSPPRVRSRHIAPGEPGHVDGITSACAEQTTFTGAVFRTSEDHLRVCGADVFRLSGTLETPGSPPRVRSRQPSRAWMVAPDGITSACAEQTGFLHCDAARSWDHLRVCGADYPIHRPARRRRGSPPRVRSRHVGGRRTGRPVGITSACAEQTSFARRSSSAMRDHLRVCGADDGHRTDMTLDDGSPPRVRSRLPRSARSGTSAGITSACAEQTPSWNRHAHGITDHLRVCGADSRPALSCL